LGPIIGKFSQETLAEIGKLEIRNSLLKVVLYDKPEIRKHDASEGST